MAQLPRALTLKALLENPDLLNPPKPNEGSDQLGKKLGGLFSSQSASLIPSLWDKTFSLDDEELGLELVNFDDLIDNDILDAESSNGAGGGGGVMMEMDQDLAGLLMAPVPVKPLVSSTTTTSDFCPGSPVKVDLKVDFNVASTDVAISSVPGEEVYDPRKRHFSEDELRPMPLIKKSKKTYVPEDEKDERYWKRRSTNNVAAKRSRDARRIKMNQISLRTAYLEKENGQIRQELEKTLSENSQLKKQINTLLGGATG